MSVFAEILREEMQARGWTEEDVAQRMGPESQPGLNRILLGLCLHVDEAHLDQETAAKLGLAFGMPKTFFLTLDQQRREDTR